MFSTIFSNRKRWQKVKDGESLKRRREEAICHDRTHLLEGSDGGTGNLAARKGRWLKVKELGHAKRLREEPISSDGDDLPGGNDEEAVDEKLEEVRQEVEPQWVADMGEFLAAAKSSKEQLLVASSVFAKDVREWLDRNSRSADVACCGGSWRGVRTLLRKQFMPSNLKKDALEDLHLHDQNERGRMDTREEATKVLSSRTNLIDLRNMDAKIKGGVTKSTNSAFPNSVKISGVTKHHRPTYKENLSESLTPNKMLLKSDSSTNSITVKTKIRKPIWDENRRNKPEGAILRNS